MSEIEELVPFHTLFRRVPKRTGHGDKELLSVYRDYGVIIKSDRDDNFNRPGESLDDYQLVKPGDLVLNKMKTWQGSLGVSNYEGIVSPAYFVYEPQRKFDSRFVHHQLRAQPAIDYFGAHSKGIRVNQWDLQPEYLDKMRVWMPPLETQRRIAEYLDRETAEIDAAVADLDRYVELLEKRLELSVAKMLEKDQHPSVPLFTMCDFSSGEGIPRDELHESGEYPVYGGNGIMGYSKQYNQSVDSIVVGRVGALCGNVHLAKAPFFVTDNAMVVSLKEAVSLNWLVFALRDLRLRELSQSSAQPVITSTKVSRQRVSRPSFSRQSQIADSILNEASEVNALIADSINLRDLLIRRRSVLISDVVTGRKQV